MRAFIPLTAAVGLAAGLPAQAQSFPTGPVEIVVPFDAGGANDLAARAVQSAFSEDLGQPVVVLNKAGAGGALGITEVMKDKADGYTLLLLASNNLIYEPNFKTTAYNTETFDFICRIFAVPVSLAIAPSAPFKDVAGMIAYAKENPGKILYGTPAIGGIYHVAMLALQRATGTEMTRVPFTGGAPMIQALASGQIHVAADTPTTIANAGLSSVAMFANERAPEAQNVPTLKELGVNTMEFVGFAGLVAPRGLAGDVRARLETACEKAMANPSAVDTLKRINLRPAWLSAADYKANAKEVFTKVGVAMREAGVSNK
nr:tripartite tricarboxylate transporter substrate binding protein [Chelatococcus sp.]